MRTLTALCVFLLLAASAFAQDDEAPKVKQSELSSYIIDIDAGAVSAGDLVGLQQSAIQQIQTSQDLLMALTPLSSANSKTGFGLAITPARTKFIGLSAQEYYDNPLKRALGSLTFSYAENSSTISSTSYRKQAVSADMFYYLDREKDPIVVAHKAFGDCNDREDMQGAQSDALGKLGKAIRERKAAERAGVPAAIAKAKAAQDQAQKEYDAIVARCLEEGSGAAKSKSKSPWNASRVSLSLGEGWIRPEDNSTSRESLGRSVTLGGIFGVLQNGAAYVSLRHTADEVDLSTLKAAVQHKSSSLAAARFVYGTDDDNGDLKALAEVSNAKESEITASNAVFKYAVGLDKKIAKGTWLQFRLGRNRTIDGTSTQTTSLLTFTFAPTAALFAK
jgi:hypothetical protein